MPSDLPQRPYVPSEPAELADTFTIIPRHELRGHADLADSIEGLFGWMWPRERVDVLRRSASDAR